MTYWCVTNYQIEPIWLFSHPSQISAVSYPFCESEEEKDLLFFFLVFNLHSKHEKLS